jgi:uncharacterized protein (DUF2236 family)
LPDGIGAAIRGAFSLPGIGSTIDRFYGDFLTPPGVPDIDFLRPRGAAALVGPDSVSWQIFKNPVTLFVGGVAAVLMELAESRIRHGVWTHSNFPSQPRLRLQRTGLAAMATVYAPEPAARSLIAGVVRAHEAVKGRDEFGQPYNANDPELLAWVQGTAVLGFAGAYDRLVAPLSDRSWDFAFAEAEPAARLYGVERPALSRAEMDALIDSWLDRLTPSPVIGEFLALVRGADIFPGPLRAIQRGLVDDAIGLVPPRIRDRIGLDAPAAKTSRHALLAQLADEVVPGHSPAVQACLRLGLPNDYLQQRRLD